MNIYTGEAINAKSKEIMELIEKSKETEYNSIFLETDIRLVLHRIVEEVKDNTRNEIMKLITTNDYRRTNT